MKTTSLAPKQDFSIKAPQATSVCLVGDFTHWQQEPIAMKRGKDGVWKASIPLPAGTHHYRFLVDGQWQDDPACPLHEPNPFGTQNDIRVVA
jgi:1,4-alpha-glucan branching enzyme